MRYIKSFIFIGIITLFISSTIFAQQTGSLSGQVVDSLSAVVVGATVTAVDSTGKEKTTTTNRQGEYTINGLAAGTFTVRVIAPNFGLYENMQVEVKAGERAEVTVVLTVEAIQEKVQVNTDNQVSTDSDGNASATVLKGATLDALPDDPDELEAALQALAGPSAGPNGGQIYIDGFTGGRIPPKESIREIRINQNPFSAEFDRLGFGRVEILTRPGSNKWHGQGFFNFNDESLNSRNPFALNRAPSQTRFYGGNVSGPIQKGKSSFFFDISNRSVESGAVVNATVLDSAFNIVPFQQEFAVPTRRFSVSPRFDYAINDKNTLVARYNFTRFTAENQNIGNFSLLSRASTSSNKNHDFQITETAIINPKTINETRFRYEIESRDQQGDNSIPTISVASAFTGGGAQIGLNYTHQNNWELQNYTTTTLGRRAEHSVKFGVRLRGTNIEDRSESNYGGTFTFAGLPEVRRNTTCIPQEDPTCIITPAVSSIEQYRQKLLGNPDPRFNPNQFSITAGNPLADVSQFDFGGFITDDWRINPKLTLSMGLRYENQTNISDKMNFAPRIAFAYSPGAGGARPPKTVFRGGIGVFYDRFSDNFTLQANRFDGSQQLNYIVTNNQAILGQPVFTLNGVTNVPTAVQLGTVAPLTSTIRQVASDVQAPYTIQALFTVERQLPFKTTVSATYVTARNLHFLRSRNVNAPVCPPLTTCPTTPAALSLLRPDPTRGNIYQFESSGVSNQQQFIINFRTFLSTNFTVFGNYRLGFAKSDTDGGFPAYSYDTSNEYGSSAFDTRHFFVVGGSFGLPWGVRASPFVFASSGRPFNITAGLDTNGDSIFLERPTYSALNLKCQQLGLTNSFCDVGGISNPDTTIIPRNFGRGPSNVTVNLRLDKTFGFGKSPERPVAARTRQGGQDGGRVPGVGGGGGGGRGGRGGRGGGGGGGFGGGNERKPYNLTVGLNFNNLLNRTNLGTPVGSLSSTFFGQSTSTAGGFGGFRGGGFGGGGNDSGNRRVELQMRFSF
ncbi:MAG: carboxypeptidase regulatory-like domain-containing protein [Pyrinomonadaceae bacterium]